MILTVTLRNIASEFQRDPPYYPSERDQFRKKLFGCLWEAARYIELQEKKLKNQKKTIEKLRQKKPKTPPKPTYHFWLGA